MSTNSDKFSERDEIKMLLPWYVTGKLDSADKKRVEAYLERDTELQNYLHFVREVKNETVSLNGSVTVPTVDDVERLVIEVGECRHTELRSGYSLFTKIKEFCLAPAEGTLRWVSVAAVLLILVQAVAIGMLVATRDGGVYRFATGPSGAAVSGTFVLVRFADGASVSNIAKVLANHKMTIADGPKGNGMFKVRIGPKGMSKAESSRQLDALKQRRDLVLFVSPTK